jgi:hypothetical protein
MIWIWVEAIWKATIILVLELVVKLRLLVGLVRYLILVVNTGLVLCLHRFILYQMGVVVMRYETCCMIWIKTCCLSWIPHCCLHLLEWRDLWNCYVIVLLEWKNTRIHLAYWGIRFPIHVSLQVCETLVILVQDILVCLLISQVIH